ncbi:MAG: AAA family ATPase [Bacteroidaceae bacterium]|nr:AAA family ATPase [Bacteroidaceae bacterium]
MAIAINTKELETLLEVTPSWQNIMLAGRHGIGKSQILTNYFESKGMRVVALFLGQMSDPGDLLGLPNKDEATGKTTFMPPYWFPVDGEPIVLFLDELNRARPEILQTVMDLVLNRKLAGRMLPEGSRIISACNDGDEYQLTDLDPALVSRFNIYTFRPSVEEWLLWATRKGLDERVINFIQANPELLDRSGDTKEEQGLEKDPDRRAWEKVARAMENIPNPMPVHQKIIAGIVGVQAAARLFLSFQKELVTPQELLTNFKSVKRQLDKYQLHQLSLVNDALCRFFETDQADTMEHTLVRENLKAYHDYLAKNHREAYAHFVSLIDGTGYKQMLLFINKELPETYKQIIEFIQSL